MANGKVIVGFSKPYVALYKCEDGVVSFTNRMSLARGVNVNIEADASSDNDFYADNQKAESAGGVFVSGTMTVTVDGLKKPAENLIMGVPVAGEDGWSTYDDDQKIPYVGIGFVVKYMEDGEFSYVPFVFPRCKFKQIPESANTQGEAIEFQTQALTADITRAEDAKHSWKFKGADFETEEEAVAKIEAKLA